MADVYTNASDPPREEADSRVRMDRHRRAVLSAEVHMLVSELQIQGPLTRTALARRCRANHWTEGSLDAAIQAGVRQGVLVRRPFGYVDVARAPRPAPSARRSADTDTRTGTGTGTGTGHTSETAERRHRQ